MSTQITRKSTADEPAAPVAAAASATSLANVGRSSYTPSHGQPADPMPAAPVGLFDLGTAAAFRVGGPDRETWLQGMASADVRRAAFGGGLYTAFLGGKGRLVSDGLVFRYPEELIVVVPRDRLDAVMAHLDKLLIMEDAELSIAEGLHHLRYYPGDAPPAVAGADRITGIWNGLGLELLLPEAQAPELRAALPRGPQPSEVEQHRVALGVPLFGRDLDTETVPLEGGLDRAISFDKGCYVGQEVVAMATFRGRVLWNLVRLQVDGSPPALGSLLDPKRAGLRGRVTSAVPLPGGERSALLGYVHKELIVPGSKVDLEDGRTATVLGLPYESRPGAGVCA